MASSGLDAERLLHLLHGRGVEAQPLRELTQVVLLGRRVDLDREQRGGVDLDRQLRRLRPPLRTSVKSEYGEGNPCVRQF